MLLCELATEAGGLLLLTEPETVDSGEPGGQREEKTGNHRRIVSAVPYWGVDSVEIREILCRPADKGRVLSALGRWFGDGRAGKRPKQVSVVGAAFELEKKKPVIMGRIADAVSFLELFASDRPMEVFLELSDELLEDNCGIYRWSLSPRGSLAERIAPPEGQLLRAAEALPAGEAAGDGSRKAGDVLCPERIRMTAAELFSCLMGGAEPEGALGKVRRCGKSYINEIV